MTILPCWKQEVGSGELWGASSEEREAGSHRPRHLEPSARDEAINIAGTRGVACHRRAANHTDTPTGSLIDDDGPLKLKV